MFKKLTSSFLHLEYIRDGRLRDQGWSSRRRDGRLQRGRSTPETIFLSSSFEEHIHIYTQMSRLRIGTMSLKKTAVKKYHSLIFRE